MQQRKSQLCPRTDISTHPQLPHRILALSPRFTRSMLPPRRNRTVLLPLKPPNAMSCNFVDRSHPSASVTQAAKPLSAGNCPSPRKARHTLLCKANAECFGTPGGAGARRKAPSCQLWCNPSRQVRETCAGFLPKFCHRATTKLCRKAQPG